MAEPAKVTVTRSSTGTVACEPDTVVLYPTRPDGPSDVVWTLGEGVTSATLEIRWLGDTPFGTMVTSPDGRTVEGRENTGETGEFPYEAVLRSPEGGNLGRIDPKIVNRPWP